MKQEHPIKTMCEVLEVLRSGHNRWRSADLGARKSNRGDQGPDRPGARDLPGTTGNPLVTAALHQQGESAGSNVAV